MYATVHRGMSKDNFWKSVLSFQCVGPRNRTQDVKLDGKYLELLNHLTGSITCIFLFICFSETGLHSSPDLDLNSQRSTYPCLRCAGIQGMCHHTCYYLFLKKRWIWIKNKKEKKRKTDKKGEYLHQIWRIQKCSQLSLCALWVPIPPFLIELGKQTIVLLHSLPKSNQDDP